MTIEEQNQELLRVIKLLIIEFTSGQASSAMNPYCRPVVKEGMELVARLQGKSHWLDAELQAGYPETDCRLITE